MRLTTRTLFACMAVINMGSCHTPVPLTTLNTMDDSVLDDVSKAEITTQFVSVCSDPDIENSRVASLHQGNYSRGEIAELECLHGYRFASNIPSAVLKCQASGVWTDLLDNPILPRCELIGACPIPTLPFGTFDPNSSGHYMPGDLAGITCDSGYILSPPLPQALLRCQNDGTWIQTSGSDDMPTCERQTCGSPPEIPNAMHLSLPDQFYEGTKVYYRCNDGYNFVNNEQVFLQCNAGEWAGRTQECTQIKLSYECFSPPFVLHGDYKIFRDSERLRANYSCKQGYKRIGNGTIGCHNGRWLGERPVCVTLSKGCPLPPPVLHATYNILGGSESVVTGRVSDGAHAYYTCETSYRTVSSNLSILTCLENNWLGNMPQCERRTNCDAPMEIPHGQWYPLSLQPHNHIGARIGYQCDAGYRSRGATELKCLGTGYWSDYAPRCLHTEKFCPDPGPIEHGYYMCSPNHCDLFSIGTEVHFMCKRSYVMSGKENSVVITCLSGGKWSNSPPYCRPESGYSNGLFDTSTLTVVVSTSCGVLSVLIVVVLLVIFKQRRFKGRLRLSNPASPPPTPPHPDYSHPAREEPAADEHDRVALIAFANGVSVMLPSYEEAVRGRHHFGGPRLSRFNSDTSSMTSSTRSSSRGDYRPLPSLPPNLRRPITREEYQEALREAFHDPYDYHRNSVITNASIATRDNVSLAFGSIDTMNVSDNTSTSVTVDTYDSMASNPSLALSQRAALGSILSSSTHSNLTSEGAPLLSEPTSSPSPILPASMSCEQADSAVELCSKDD